MPEQRVANKVKRQQKRIEALEAAVLWALGYGHNFPERPQDGPLYWWRGEFAEKTFPPKGIPSKRKVAQYRKSIERRNPDGK